MGNPLDFFEAGRKGGKANQSPFVDASANVMSAFDQQAENQMKMNQLMGVEKYKNSLTTPKEDAMTEYYKSAAALNKSLANGGGNGVGNLDTLANQAGFSPDDYIQNPTVTRYKGQMQVQNAPQLKPILPSKEAGELSSIGTQTLMMQRNLDLLKAHPAIAKKMGPMTTGHFTSSRLPFSNLALDTQAAMGDQDARDFKIFKGDAYKVFDNYRKWATGVQASYPELKLLEVSVPQPTSDDETFKQQSMDAIKNMEANKDMLLDFQSNRGYRVGELRGNKLQDAANGAGRADQAPDASTTANLLPVEQAREAVRAKIANEPKKAQLWADRFKKLYPGEEL